MAVEVAVGDYRHDHNECQQVITKINISKCLIQIHFLLSTARINRFHFTHAILTLALMSLSKKPFGSIVAYG